jgi:1-acyl-sn-glycerol-3-phosphate acyltransferase
MSKIQEKSVGYNALKGFLHYLYPKFFREIEIRGLENIPAEKPVIFAANHQNALMDALAVILFQTDLVVYMARADMFQNPVSAKLLRFIKIAPIYRIRDGYENLAKNETQMREAVDVLLDHKRLGVMPEGNQGRQHKLRPLVKGLFRIAYAAEEMKNGDLHVQIVPIGIDYSHYQHAGTDLVVSYGTPIDVSSFLPLYQENPANGLNALRDLLAEKMSELMHDVRSENYDRTYRLCCYGVTAWLDHQAEYGTRMNATTMAGLRFDARCALGKLFDRMESMQPEKLEALDRLCQRLKILPGSPNEVAEWMEEKMSDFQKVLFGIVGVILSPGLLLNFPGWYINRLIVSKVEDTQMHSTFAFTMGMLFNAIVYVLSTIVLSAQMNATFLQGVILFAFISVVGVVSERARQALKAPWRAWKYAYGKRKELLKTCQADYSALKTEIKSILQAG